MSKDKLWAIQRQTQTVIAAITVLGIVMSLIAAMFLTNRITRRSNPSRKNSATTKIGARRQGLM